MSLQTKLTQHQRDLRKAMIANNPRVSLHSFSDMGVTVALMRTGDNRGVFSVSIMGKDETKFRRKVGEFVALVRIANGQRMPFRWENWNSADDAAKNIANGISC